MSDPIRRCVCITPLAGRVNCERCGLPLSKPHALERHGSRRAPTIVQANTNFARIADIPPGFTGPFTVGHIPERHELSLRRQHENAAADAAEAAIDFEDSADINDSNAAGDDAPDLGGPQW